MTQAQLRLRAVGFGENHSIVETWGVCKTSELRFRQSEVLVHQGTVEERMSRHRTRSVLGVNYESVDANSLLQSPESTLGNGSDFFPSRQKLQASSFRELDEQHQAAMKKTLAGCVELSKRVANSLRSGKKCREAKLSEIRKWLRGESSPGTPEDQDDEAGTCWDMISHQVRK